MKRAIALSLPALALSVVLLAPRSAAPPPAAPAAAAPALPRAQVVVGLAGPAADLHARAAAAAAAVEGGVVSVCADLAFAVVEAPGEAPALARALAARPGVAWAEPNRAAIPAAGPGRCTCQGGGTGRLAPARGVHDLAEVKEALRLPEAWLEAPARGAGVLVAVVDTGVDAALEALRDACEAAIDLTDPGGAAADEHGHGTAMSAVIAGRGEGARGFEGVAPGARVLPVKVADERGAAPLDRVARGILVAAERGARVIYVGLGVRGRSPTLAAAVAHARRAGALVVAPAGNDALDQVRSPAAEPGALAIGGLGAHERALSLATNRGPEVALWAPAERVPAPYRGRACWHEGTSTAAALTAGVAALALGRAPDLDAPALARCLQAGGAPVAQVERTVLAERLPARALDALGAVLRAARDHAEVQAVARLAPAVPQAGRPARLEVVVTNVGHAPLARVDVDVVPRGAGALAGALPPRQQVVDLAPGEARTLTFAVTPAEGRGGALVEVQAAPRAGAAGPAAPCLARAVATWTATAAPRASFAVAGVRLLDPVTVDAPLARFEVVVENRGAAPGTGALFACVDGAVVADERVTLAPGERRARQVVAPLAPAALASPVQLEVAALVEGDPRQDDDVDALTVAVQDPSLPLDPLYRQAGDIDFAIDAPWRVAGDRPHVPVLVFVPSIGRPSRYTTFHEGLAMRRGASRPTDGVRPRARSAPTRAAGDLVTFTAAHFLKELAEAAQGDEAGVRRFFDSLMTSDFAIDYSLYAVGAAGGRRGFELAAGRAKQLPGLRWTGSSLGSAIARSQCAVAAGYLLPNLVRGRLDRRVAIDLASLGLTTAAVETLAHGAGRAVARTTLGQRAVSFLARHGRLARVGGWAVDVGQLVLILYASEWLSEAVERPLIRRDARRALGRSWERLRAATAGADDAEFQAALDELDDAFEAYRNLCAQELEDALTTLTRELQGVSRKLHQLDASRARTEAIPERLRESRDRVLERQGKEADSLLSATLATFEANVAKAIDGLLGADAPGAVASLSDPGTNKPALFDLQARLLAELEAAAPPARQEQLRGRRQTVLRIRDLEVELLRALLDDAGARTPEEVTGTDGLVLRRVVVTARDTWHEASRRDEEVAAAPHRFAPDGWVRTAWLYQHDVERDFTWTAPGVVRLDEEGAPQDDPTLFEAPRPITVKGRYNLLRVPRGLLEQVAVGGAAFVHVELDWKLTKLVRGAIVEPARGRHAQMLRVQLGAPGLPTLPGLAGGYLDAHYHTIAEWYNPEPGFTADLELDAPRQKYGGPIPMLVESAYAIGAIEAPTYEAARDKLVTTDHNCFYVADDRLAHRPPYGPTSVRSSGGLTEHARMRELLGASVGEELCYPTPGPFSVGAHMLDYRSRHYDGTWNGKEPLGRLLARFTAPLDLPTLDRVLTDFARGGPGNERAFAYAAHPVGSISWSEADLERALSGYARVADRSFAFKGLQVWNTRAAREHSKEKLHQFIDDLNPFTEPAWQAGRAHEAAVHATLARYRRLLRAHAAVRHPLDEDVRFVRKHFMVAGSDAHGDFNYTLGGLATVITSVLGLNDRTDNTLELNDNAFMRARTFVATEGQEAPALMSGLARGTSVVTDGPLVWFEVDADGHLDARTGDYDLSAPPRFKDREGRIGGQGAFDGGRTAVLANDARPVLRYSYANFDEFGRPVERDALGRPVRTDGAVAELLVHKTDLEGPDPGEAWSARGRLATHGGRAFGQPLTEPLDPAEEGLVRGVAALQLEAVTAGGEGTSPADVYRCVTNPVWLVQVRVVAHLDPRRFDAARGVILPGGLSVELRSPVSLAPDRLGFTLKALDARGRSGEALAALEPDGWGPGQEPQGRPYRDGVLRASNRVEVPLRGLARSSPPGRGSDPSRLVTLVAVTAAPLRDAFGNALNPVAAWFEVDPRTGAPGRHAAATAAADLAPVTLDPPRGRGIVDVLRGE
ncbi:MAG: S8 family serine peptidase [Planctomycetes bacterium]|nr:S8 family serine peptidase [Planctomycetota bacterium]